jgi:GTP pyrophosphokinase
MAEPAAALEIVPDGLRKLIDLIRRHRPHADPSPLIRAYELAAKAHEGQTRVSGEAYVTHPVEVAEIVAELRMDEDTIIAAILHDVLEDTTVTPEQLQAQFGREVRYLVEGVTKLKLNLPDEASENQRRRAESNRAAESLRKMLLAMAKDVRVMVIKLADRLHNMRTLESLPPEKKTRIANETLDVYAPLAARLGIWQVKWQLEDLSFKTLHPEEFKQISERVAKTRAQRDQELEHAITLTRLRLDENGLSHAHIMGRSKHLYSIFNKLIKQGIPYEEIYDLTALRIIVAKQSECYLALGLVHELWLPMPGLFYDYIAMPKPNGYQSLHTKVIGPSGDPLEIQIRTQEMHDVAEYGVAAHWSYKEDKTLKEAPTQMSALRQQLFDWSTDSLTSSDFLRTVSSDLFSEQVFAFTPKGDVIDLPKDSTPVDFAFRVHSTIGLTLVGAKVNGMMVPLSHRIQNGDVVELITRSNAQPSLDWLKFVKSQHTRSKIRAYMRKRSRTENALRGKEAIEKELRREGLDPKVYLNEQKLTEIAQKMRNVFSPEDIYARVGEGLTGVQTVVARLKGSVQAPPTDGVKTVKPQADATVITGGIDNVMIRRAKCCTPIPGDDVAGYVTRGRGIMIHRRVCPNLLKLMEDEPERVSPVDWRVDEKASFTTHLRIVSVDRDGLLNDITSIFANEKVSVVAANIRTLKNRTAEIDFTINVRDIKQLRHVMTKIGGMSDVLSLQRLFSRSGR